MFVFCCWYCLLDMCIKIFSQRHNFVAVFMLLTSRRTFEIMCEGCPLAFVAQPFVRFPLPRVVQVMIRDHSKTTQNNMPYVSMPSQVSQR